MGARSDPALCRREIDGLNQPSAVLPPTKGGRDLAGAVRCHFVFDTRLFFGV